jgi:hypothetical protein
MKTSKYFLFAAMFVLLTGLSFGVMAQGRMTSEDSIVRLPPPQPIMPDVSVNAIEITDGTMGLDNQTKAETVFGYSFLGQTTGSFNGSFTLSMNCTPAAEVPGGISELTGGSWTLPVYATAMQSGYSGSLYGTIAQGQMNWDSRGTSANVYLVLNVTGGTQTWNNVGGYATFTGTISINEKTQKTELKGEMVFDIISPVTEY